MTLRAAGVELELPRGWARLDELPALRGAVATFHHGDDLVRVWSGSDGRSFALATYVCRKGLEHVEADAVDALVRSLRFCSAAGVS